MSIALLVPQWDPNAPKGCIENMRDLAQGGTADILAFLHSDVTDLEEDWQAKVESFFGVNPQCGLVGFGGALGLGHRDIYKRPYQLQQLARRNYFSAQRDWQTHGYLLTTPLRVAVLDGFALVFRREAFEQMGGWQPLLDAGLTYHCYDTWACCMMARLGWETWALPVKCWHHGGGVSTSGSYLEWLDAQGIAGDAEVHTKAHRIIYEEFRDVLPLEVVCQSGRR